MDPGEAWPQGGTQWTHDGDQRAQLAALRVGKREKIPVEMKDSWRVLLVVLNVLFFFLSCFCKAFLAGKFQQSNGDPLGYSRASVDFALVPWLPKGSGLDSPVLKKVAYGRIRLHVRAAEPFKAGLQFRSAAVEDLTGSVALRFRRCNRSWFISVETPIPGWRRGSFADLWRPRVLVASEGDACGMGYESGAMGCWRPWFGMETWRTRVLCSRGIFLTHSWLRHTKTEN